VDCRNGAGERDDAHRKVAPALRQIAGDLDFLNVVRLFSSVLGERASEATLEGAATAHGGAGGEEHNVWGHQGEDGLDVAGGCGRVRERDEGADGLFFKGHGALLGCDL
jgi:hypothetical protein